MMGMFSLKWNNMDPTNLMMFDVKRELHQVAMSTTTTNYDRQIGILSYEDEVFVTLVVESYNLTNYSDLPLTAFRITPYILNLGSEPIENVSLAVSYSLDLYLDSIDDHGKYDLDNNQLFAYGLSESYGNFYVGMNSSIPLSAFEVGNSSDISNHIADGNLTGSTTFDGSVGLGMQWDFGTVGVNDPVNVTIAMGFGENRTVLDASIDAMWNNDVPSAIANQGDLIVVEADLPRIAEEGQTYESYAIIMNVGVYNSSAIGAMIVAEGLGNEGAMFASYSSFDNITPFQAVNVTASWRPESKGLRTAVWAVAANLQSVIGLIQNVNTLIVGVLDDFLVRDVFVIDPISSTSVFPKILHSHHLILGSQQILVSTILFSQLPSLLEI